MNSIMLIQIRVQSAQAQRELAKVQGQEKALAASTARTASAARSMSYGLPQLSKWGNQVQWAGRQLQYNFTLPLLLAGGAAAKFQLDNEKAMTRVVKVYGDAQHQASQYKAEINSLSKAFAALSNEFGVNQAEVINIAADWAAAGASGIALARSVKLTLETMVLGEMNAADATQALISIQAQYGQSTKQLSKTIDTLNMVENQTGISMAGLIQGFSRAAGVARSTGVDVEHLGAMLAALVPSSGSAANAGNALKTILSRLLSPTTEASQVLGMLGVKMDDVNWKSLNGAQRIELLSKKYEDLGKGVSHNSRALDSNGKSTGRLISAQQAVVSTVIASRWQINRWDVLMRDVANHNGYYQKSLRATADAQGNFNQKVYELNQVLNSNPQKLKQTWVILQNAMAQVIQPMIPYIVYLAQSVANLANKFANMNPIMQKAVLFGLLFLAAIGPIARYVGSVTTLFGILSAALHFFAARLGLATVATMTETGAIEMQRKGLLGLIFTWAGWLALPFKSIFGLVTGGLLGIGGLIMKLPRLLTIMKVNFMAAFFVAKYSVLSMAGAFKTAVVATQVSGNLMVAMWGITWATIKNLWFVAQIQMLTIQTVMGGRTVKASEMVAKHIVVIWGFAASAMGAIWDLNLKGMLAKTATFARAIPLAFARIGPMILRVFTGIPGLIAIALAAALGVVYRFRNNIANAWNNILGFFRSNAKGIVNSLAPIGTAFDRLGQLIQRVFWALPSSVRDALVAVVNIIAAAAKQVYEWFKWLNPWERHSPSLVDSVTTGMDAITGQFARAKGVGSVFASAKRDLQNFQAVANKMKVNDAAKNAKSAGGGGLAGALLSDYKRLLPLEAAQERAVAGQQATVDRWSNALDKANAALDKQQNKLDSLQKHLDALQTRYDAHKDSMQKWADAPIAGMRAMDDAIFANSQEQKKLQLQMLQWQKVNGSVESVTSKIEALQGAMEVLRGEQTDLRGAGAGSDITKPIQDQIDMLDKQSKSLGNIVDNSPMAAWQAELDKLDLKGQILDLQNSLKFDGPIRQVDQLVNGMKELPLSQIIAGVTHEKSAMNALQPSIDRATAAIANQQKVVDSATKSRDAIQKRYDAESKSLDALNKKYQKTQDLVSGIEQALNSMGQAAYAANKKNAKKPKSLHLTPGAQNFVDAKGGAFPDPGSMSKIGREGGWGDQSKMIDEFTKGVTGDIAKNFGRLNVFAPLKAWWARTWASLTANVGPVVAPLGDAIRRAMGKLSNVWDQLKAGFSFGGQGTLIGDTFGKAMGPMFALGQKVRHIFDSVVKTVQTVLKWGGRIAKLFGPDLTRILAAFKRAGSQIWRELGPELAKFGPLLKPLMKIFKVLAIIIGVTFIAALKLVASIISVTLGPVLSGIITIVKGIILVIRGLLEVFIGIFTGNLTMFVHGVLDILRGLMFAIGGVFKVGWSIVRGIIVGVFQAIIDAAKWLYNVLVGHSIIPDLVRGIMNWFHKLGAMGKWLWDHSFAPIIAGAKKLFRLAMAAFRAWLSGWKIAWSALKTIGKWLWDNVFSPVVNKVKSLWTDHVRPLIGGWWANWKANWASLTKLGRWLWDNVMKPIIDKVKAGWIAVRDWLKSNKDMLLGPVNGVVNAVVGAVNTMIKGLNKISDVLPGINFHIDLIPQLAKGGPIQSRRVGGGFKTSGARAIVGEGKASHPEFVIPTDPTYKKRAQGLLALAGQKLGMHVSSDPTNKGVAGDSIKDMTRVLAARGETPMFASGGVLGAISGALGATKDMVKGASSWVKGNIKKLASTPFAAFKALAQDKINKIGWPPARGVANKAMQLASSFTVGADAALAHKAGDIKKAQKRAAMAAEAARAGTYNGKLSNNARVKRAQIFAKSQVGDPYVWGGVGPNGFDCSGFMSAITNVLMGRSPYSRVGATSSFPWGGFGGGYDPAGFTIGSTNNYGGSGVGHMAGTLGGMNVESRGGHGVIVGSGARGWNDPGFNTYGHLLGLQSGGIIKASRYGTVARIGEGGRDEAVTPLPRGWRNNVPGNTDSGTKKEYHFHGVTFQFPSVKNDEDAQAFLDRLEILVKD